VAAAGATYLWDFGNGQTSTDQVPAPFRYASAGNYNITLTVRNANGCETVKTIVHQAIANPIINPQVSPNQAVCIGRPVTLSASGGVNYSWTPSTGLSNPNIANPIATPSVTTTYTVRVDNSLGCFRDVSTTLTVAPNPTADFTLQVVDSCSLFPTVLLRNLSTNATSFLWDFGNGVRSNQFSPSINYTQAGNYIIRLYAYNGETCASSAQKNVEIRQNSLIQPVIQPVRAICKGDSVQLQASGGTRYLWSPATGLSNPNIANPKASPSQSITYTLSIFNQFNCRKDTSVTVQVFPSIAANFDVLLTENCTRFPLVNLRNLSFPLENIRFFWDFGNGQTSTLQNPAPFRYANEGTYTICLRVSNAGCVVKKTYQLAYKENTDFDFVQRISTSKNPKICAGDSTQLFATGGTTYLWSPTLGLSAANIANPIAFPKTTTLYTVRINNALGCFKDTSILVTVAPKVQADFAVSLLPSCEDEFPLVRIIPTLQNGESYLWTFGNDSSYVGEKPPAFRYTKAGTYTIKVRGFNQICEQTQSKTVKIERNDVDFAKNIKILPQKPTICEGEAVQLQVTGGTKYLWTPATGLNNPTIANPIAKPTVTTRYQVRISNERGCFVDSSILVVVAPNIKPDFELQVTSECGKNGTVKFINRSTGTGEYKWTLGNGEELKGQNPADYGFEKSGEYEIILEIFNGVCRKTQSQKVKIETVKPANVITPNGDGKNDKFILDMLEEGWKIEIYDRNGALKFKSDNYQNDWGQDVNSGTYYYLLISPSGKTCKGWVQVLKGE
jgi:gliding motility-associated-like protein